MRAAAALCALLLLASCAPPELELLFCPQADCYDKFKSAVENSKGQCAIFSIEKELEEAMQARGFEIIKNSKSRGGLMHHKFCIFNSSIVWTGSWNAKNGSEANNVLIFRSRAIADFFKKEFLRLKGVKVKSSPKKFKIGPAEIEILFCPRHFCKSALLARIAQAKREIVFMHYVFTDWHIAKLLNSKAGAGVKVAGLLTKFNSSAELAKAFAKPAKAIHHKVFILDSETVVTGTYNPSFGAAEKNAETLIFIKSPVIAQAFLSEFERLYAQAPGFQLTPAHSAKQLFE